MANRYAVWGIGLVSSLVITVRADDTAILTATHAATSAKQVSAFEEFFAKLDALDQDAHPLIPALNIARDGYRRISAEVQDYTCTMIRRERVGGRLLGPERMFAKVRHSQKSANLYLRFDAPASVAGRELLYCCQEPEKLLVRNGGRRFAFVTLEIEPTSALAMAGNRYPVTEFGILRLVERMLSLGRQELAHEECDVEIDEQAEFDGKDCTLVSVCHPSQRSHFEYHLARIYIDRELGLPVRFEAYDWPDAEGEPPVLVEEYTYRDIRVNVGLSDQDFVASNPEYQFRLRD